MARLSDLWRFADDEDELLCVQAGANPALNDSSDLFKDRSGLRLLILQYLASAQRIKIHFIH